MSAREPLQAEQILIEQQLDDRATQILTDGRKHAPQALRWAIRRVPFLAGFKQSELALAQYEVHRS